MIKVYCITYIWQKWHIDKVIMVQHSCILLNRLYEAQEKINGYMIFFRKLGRSQLQRLNLRKGYEPVRSRGQCCKQQLLLEYDLYITSLNSLYMITFSHKHWLSGYLKAGCASARWRVKMLENYSCSTLCVREITLSADFAQIFVKIVLFQMWGLVVRPQVFEAR